jgi:hypothetical protein
MSPALANRGAGSFVALLVVLLAAMLLAVIRARMGRQLTRRRRER